MSGVTTDGASERTTHHVYHDHGSDDAMSQTIVDAVAAYENARPEELPPLDRSINPDALDSIFVDAEDGTRGAGSLTFSYSGYVVVVMSTGQILLRKPAEASP